MINGEQESILYYFTSVSLHCNIGPIYRTHIGKWKITLQSTHQWQLQSYGRLRDGHPLIGIFITCPKM